MNKRKLLAAAAATTVTSWPVRKEAVYGLRLAALRWREDPQATLSDILRSLGGQAFFWTVGQDYIGIGMDRKWGPGLGHVVARQIQRQIPATAAVAWTLKVIEIASDATKMPVEGKLYRELGIVPDAVAALVTQPAWSLLEVTEKIIGVLNHPERVNTPRQLADSISSIYGTWSRHLLNLLLLKYGDDYRRLTNRILLSLRSEPLAV